MTTDFSCISLPELAARIGQALQEHGVQAVLVGGACATIYSREHYLSYDLDYVVHDELPKVRKALQQLGFEERGRHFQRPECPFFVDLVAPPVAIGHEPIHSFAQITTRAGVLNNGKPAP